MVCLSSLKYKENVKIGVSSGARHQVFEKVLPSTHRGSYYGSANQANHIQTRGGRKITEIEHRTGRI
jgi:hypothetical protein